MKYVYLIRSISSPKQRYVGVTGDLRARFAAHNSGRSAHTSKYLPWELVAYLAFRDPKRAASFERYLKTGSGYAFAAKRFW